MRRKKGRGKKAERKRGPQTKIFTGIVLPGIVFERSYGTESTNRQSRIRANAAENRRNPTRAERELNSILDRLGEGALKGKYRRQHVISGKWIVDVFFPEIRLAIEVDGSIHLTEEQKALDREKDADCDRFDITMLRITNSEVFGNRDALIDKLRDGWRRALRRENRIVGRSYEDVLGGGHE